MTQRRRTQTATWAQTPRTWIALAVAFAAISLSNCSRPSGGGRDLAHLPAVAFAAAAVSFLWQARRCARRARRADARSGVLPREPGRASPRADEVTRSSVNGIP